MDTWAEPGDNDIDLLLTSRIGSSVHHPANNTWITFIQEAEQGLSKLTASFIHQHMSDSSCFNESILEIPQGVKLEFVLKVALKDQTQS